MDSFKESARLTYGLFAVALMIWVSGCTETPATSRSNQDSGPTPVVAGGREAAKNVWCPTTNGAFQAVSSYADLPNDPIGDGETHCYMAAIDTSLFSTNKKPLRSCARLDRAQFPGHTCIEIRTPTDFKSMEKHNRAVGILLNDLEIKNKHMPYISGKQESHWYIGTYDEDTMRPVLIRQLGSKVFRWRPQTPVSSLTVINARLHSLLGECIDVGSQAPQQTITIQSVTAKCKGRIMVAAFETPPSSKTFSVDDFSKYPTKERIYLRRLMGRAKNSHSIYLDRTLVNWVEDSIILGAWEGGKHPAKLTAQNVVVRGSIFSNIGTHGKPIDDPEYRDNPSTPLREGNLACLSLASCSRVAIDQTTMVMNYDENTSNPNAAQWQMRDAVGAGCDLPLGYYPNGYPTKPYKGPIDYQGTYFAETPFWKDSYWDSIDEKNFLNDKNMIVSYVTTSEVIQTVRKEQYRDVLYALFTAGTYPTTRLEDMSTNIAPEVPTKWKERQRIVVAGNCFDSGLLPDHIGRVHFHLPDKTGTKHAFDNTEKYVLHGTNRCADRAVPPPEVIKARDAFIHSLPQPPWTRWGTRP